MEPRGKTLQERIGTWADWTFPQATVHTIFAHMGEEFAELEDAIRRSPQPAPPATVAELARREAVEEELADICILACHLAHRYGFNLRARVEEKFAVVQGRRYKAEPEPAGYWKHEEEA